MLEGPGLRETKKARTRQRIADVAGQLFGERGYDAVTMLDVARAAEVSDQTVYNYFSAKQDLVLDRADEIRGHYRAAVAQRPAGTSPASALEPFVHAIVERYRTTDLVRAKGEFIAQVMESPVLRRFALEEYERQAQVITGAILESAPELPSILARAHAASIVAVIQAIYDQLGTNVLNGSPQDESADAVLATLDVAFTSLDQTFACLVADAATSTT